MSKVRPPFGLWQCFNCLTWTPDREIRCRGCDLSRNASDWREETVRLQRQSGLRR